VYPKMTTIGAIEEYAKQMTETRINLRELLKYIVYIGCRIDTRFILLPTIIEYIKSQQTKNLEPLDINGIKALKTETEQVMVVANFASIKYLNTKKTIEGLIPFIKQWELFCLANSTAKKVIELNFEELYKITDSLTK